MEDKDRIEQIMIAKGLNKVEFSAKTGIATASLSHMSSGRSNPTLSTFRAILKAFPDLNPEWVYDGIGEMYRSVESSSVDASNGSSNFSSETSGGESFSRTSSVYSSEPTDIFANIVTEVSKDTRKPQTSNVYPKSSAPVQVGSSLSAAEIVKETLLQMHHPKRNIVEVRIFFDDGTYEAFSPRGGERK